MIALAILLILLGIALLYFGGEMLVGGSIRLARSFGVGPVVIGLTIVAFATSSPELATTITASLQGKPEIAVGNAFGSNVANLGLILGLSVLFYPLRATRGFVRRETVFMLAVTLLVLPVIWDRLIDRLEGAFLFGILCLFVAVLLKNPPPEADAEVAETEADYPVWRSSLAIVAGIALLVAGAKVLVEGAVDIAEALGVPDRVIGLTLVALGTSLPELAACLVAARKGQSGIVLGNIIGSNIFNLLCILGLTPLVRPLPVVEQALRLDFWVMLAISLLTLVLLATQSRLVRWEGGLLLAIYLAYSVYLFA